MPPDVRMQAVAGRIQALVAELAAFPDPDVGEKAQELVRLLMELYGAALGTIVRVLERGDGSAGAALSALLEDELVASLLVLHDLHPHDPETRIARGLERVREVAGADLTLLGLVGTAARVQVGTRRRGRTPPPADLRRLIEEVVQTAAPEVVRVEIEGLPEAAPALVQLTRARPPASPDAARVP